MIKLIAMFLLLAMNISFLYAQSPEWLSKRPRSNVYFYGRGSGLTSGEAEEVAKQEIRLQMYNQVNAVARRLAPDSGKVAYDKKDVRAFINTVRLRTAELEDVYQEENRYYALVKYPEGGGLTLVQSVVMQYADDLGISPESVLDILDEGAMVLGARIEMVLSDTAADDYGSDVSLIFSNDVLNIQVLNFKPYNANLTEPQQRELTRITRIIFEEVGNIIYSPVEVTGHANPTGVPGEENKLLTISQNRAKTMASFLHQMKVSIGKVTGVGAKKLLGNPKIPEARGLNRRVEIETEITPWK